MKYIIIRRKHKHKHEIVDEASDINKKNTSVSEFCNFTSDQGNQKTQSRRRDMTYKPAGRKTF